MFSLIAQPHHPYRVGDFLRENLLHPKWTHFRASVAFVKKSGTQFIKDDLATFSSKKAVSVSVGIDHGGSSVEGLTQLMTAVTPSGKLWVYKNPLNTFHPKVYLFKNADEADLIIGSGNLTKGGLYENAEMGVRLSLDLTVDASAAFLKDVEATLDIWSTARPGECLVLDAALISLLRDSGELPTEAESAAAIKATKAVLKSASGKKASPFKSKPIQQAPVLPPHSATPPIPPVFPTSGIGTSLGAYGGVQQQPGKYEGGSQQGLTITFGMTLQKTDVGFGQTTAGTSARSPEIFIPLRAIDLQPTFWGWQKSNSPDPKKYKPDLAWRAKNSKWISSQSGTGRQRPVDKLDWHNVGVNLKGQAGLLNVNFWFNPKKVDVRMRANNLRSAGAVNDILLIRPAASGSLHQYDMEIIKQSHPQYLVYLNKLKEKIVNSQKRFGYF